MRAFLIKQKNTKNKLEFVKKLSVPVIYDCMDNHPSFIKNNNNRSKIVVQEKELIKKARYVLCSSQKLKSVLLERYGNGIGQKTTIVRNGYNGELTKLEICQLQSKQTYRIAYFGTLSSWFNFEFLIRSLDDIPEVEYVLMGPIAGVEIPKHKKIKYIGTVEHDELYDTVKNTDCLFMPFIVNEIIESVDPVKLYEYINFGKDILCVKYPEVERFEPYVNFYNTYDEYIDQIRKMMKNHERKYTDDQRIDFLKENDWKSRVRQIEEIIGEIK